LFDLPVDLGVCFVNLKFGHQKPPWHPSDVD